MSCLIIQKIYRPADKINYRRRTTIDPKNVRPRRAKNKKNFVNNLLRLGHKVLGNAIKTKIVSKVIHHPRHGLKKKIVKKTFHHPRKGHGKKIAKKFSKHSGKGHRVNLGGWGWKSGGKDTDWIKNKNGFKMMLTFLMNSFN